MKKALFIVLFVLFLNINALASLTGDVTGDDKVNVYDYIAIRKDILGISKLTGDKKTKADVNNDGIISILDYMMIRKIIIGSDNKQEITPSPVSTLTDYVEVYFLNTYNNSSFNGENFGANESIIVKSYNDKYILIDTGVKSNKIKEVIYNKLKELQKKSNVIIDYMIISHSHSDHIGNAESILGDANITVKNLIIKKESKNDKIYKNITNAAKEETTIIETDGEDKINEGEQFTIDKNKNVQMYLFNVKDIYKNGDCKKSGYIIAFTNTVTSSKVLYAKTMDNKYIYFDGSDYLKNGSNVKIMTTDKLEEEIDKDNPLNSRFYMYTIESRRNQCSPNANSLAVLFKVTTDDGRKYIYIPSDLENNGYSPFGEYDDKYNVIIHGYSPTYYVDYELKDKLPRFIVENSKLKLHSDITNVKKPQDYITALNIKNKFNDIINNIVIYQQAHHGINNSKEAMELLNLNQEGVYTVVPLGANPLTSHSFPTLETEYLLNRTNIMFSGGKTKNGIRCTINNLGKTLCDNY